MLNLDRFSQPMPWEDEENKIVGYCEYCRKELREEDHPIEDDQERFFCDDFCKGCYKCDEEEREEKRSDR